MCVRDFVCGLVFGSVMGLTTPPVISAQATGIREVSASERSLIPRQTRLRFTTMIVLPDDVSAHPYQTSVDIASLAPNAEITVFPWKEPADLKARTIDRARNFLKRNLPATAR